MVYKWKRGVKAPAANVQRVGEALEEIRRDEGALPAKSIVERASDKRSPLHPLFTWDDRTAAHEFRLEQARKLVRNIVVVQHDNKRGESTEVTAFVRHLPAEDKPTKQVRPTEVRAARAARISAVPTAASARERLIDQAWDELLRWSNRYQELPEFAGVRASIERARAAVSAA